MAHILVVDDDDNHRRVIARVLAGYGHRVTMAAHGAIALEEAKKDVPDLIIMDMSMPVMSGSVAAALFKQDAELAHIPIIGLSGTKEEFDKQLAIYAGCEVFLPKPTNFQDLLNTIRDLLWYREQSLAREHKK